MRRYCWPKEEPDGRKEVLATRPEAGSPAARWERRRAVRWKEAEGSELQHQRHLRADGHPARSGYRSRYPCSRAHPLGLPGSESQRGSAPLSYDKDNTVSPKVDEGNSRTQYPDSPRKYTPEMVFGEHEETLREVVFLGPLPLRTMLRTLSNPTGRYENFVDCSLPCLNDK